MSINKSCVPSIGNMLLSQLILGRLKSPVSIIVSLELIRSMRIQFNDVICE